MLIDSQMHTYQFFKQITGMDRCIIMNKEVYHNLNRKVNYMYYSISAEYKH